MAAKLEILDFEQGSAEWQAARLGIPTASDFAKLMTPTGKPSTQIEGYAAKLAAETWTGVQPGWGRNEWTDRGHALEDEARANYQLWHDLTDDQCKQVGFCRTDIDILGRKYGCSPDSMIKRAGLLEIKCLKDEHHVAAHAYYAANGKPVPDYYAQCQGQLLVTGRNWVDLLFYHPALPELVVRIPRDEDYLAILADQVLKVVTRRDELLELLTKAAA